MKPWEEFGGASADASKPWEAFGGTSAPQGKGLAGHARDLGLSALKSAIAVPETVVGLADIPAGGRIGKLLENEGGAVGFRPGQAKEYLSEFHTDQYKAQQKTFAETDGIMAKTGVALSNPSLVANTVVESLAPMLAGGVLARGVMGATKLGEMGTKGAIAAGAMGEGAVMAGMQASEIRHDTDDGLLTPMQSGASVGTGALGALFGFAGGRLAQKLGIGDVNTMLAGGVDTSQVAGELLRTPAKSIPRQIIEGAITEGLFEELPQSVSEQIIKNLALDRDWSEGVEDAAVLGALAGKVMGGSAAGVAGFARRGAQDAASPAGDVIPGPAVPRPSERMGLNPADGPVSAAAALAVDSGATAALARIELPGQRNEVEAEREDALAAADAPAQVVEPPAATIDPMGSPTGTSPVMMRRDAQQDLTAEPIQALESRLEYLQQQAKATGWSKPLTEERARVSAELAIRQKSAETVAAPLAGDERSGIEGADIDGDWTMFSESSGTLGVPRADMPQIKAEHRGAMINFLKARGVSHAEATVAADSLKPTQAEYSREKVAKAKAFEGGDRSILISKDGHVLDGHHQWLAKLEQGEDVKVIRLDAPIAELVQAAREFPSSTQEGGAAVARSAQAIAEPNASAGAQATVKQPEPPNWRRNYLQARRYARDLGVPVEGSPKLVELVSPIDTYTGRAPQPAQAAKPADMPSIAWTREPGRKLWRSNDGQIITDESFTAGGVKTRFFPVYASAAERQAGNNYASGESLAEAKSKAKVAAGFDGPLFSLGVGASRRLSRGDVKQLAIETVGEATVLGRFRFTAYSDLPTEILQKAGELGAKPEEVRAVHWRDTTYLVDDRFENAKEARQAIFHEHYAHFGLRAKYGLELRMQLGKLLAGIGGLKGLRQMAKQQGIDLSSYAKELLGPKGSPDGPFVMMEELLAHMAESTGSLRRVIEEFVGMVRNWLRQKGYAELANLGATDLAFVLREARQAAINASYPAAGGGQPKFSMAPVDTAEHERSSSDSAVRFKLDLPARGQASAAVGAGLSRALKGKLSDLKPAGLGALPLMYLRDFAPKTMTALDRYLEQKRAMDADRNEMHVRYDAIAQKWLKLRMEGASIKDKAKILAGRKILTDQALDSLMHDATQAAIDPSKPRRPDQDRTEYAALRNRFTKLSPAQQALFGEVRDAYLDQIRAIERTVEENIRKSAGFAIKRARRDRNAEIEQARDELAGEELNEAIDSAEKRYQRRVASAEAGTASKLLLLRQKFESMRVDEPYFPLKRFGDYFVSLRDGNKLASFSMFEKAADMEAAAEELRRAYPDLKVSTGRKSIKQDLAGAVDPGFVSDLQELVARLPNSEEISDQMWQLYLDTLPDYSLRKGFIHRKKVPGFHQDAMRAFASSMFHSSHQIARLKHSLEMNELVEQAEEQAKAAADPVDAMTIANELRRRHEWVMNPQGGKVAQAITSAAFVYQLGITPAAAFVNTTQTFMLGVPILGTRFKSEAKATRELLRASKQFVTGRGHLDNELSGDEKSAFAEFMRMGLIDKTQAHDLAGVGETGVEYSAVRHKVMGFISYLFHNAERYNREVTSIAAYRMARESGLAHEAAVKEAAELTWMTHFDYSSGNRARYMQSDTAKVLLVFRQHSVNMLARLTIDARQALKGESPAVRAEARRRLAGIYGMFALMAGMLGVPGAQAVLLLLSALDDDDDPWTTTDKIRQSVTEALGEDLSRAFFKGVPGTLADLNLTDRVGMGHLWFFSSNRELEGRDAYVYWMEQMLGAAPAMVSNAFTGASMMGDGHVLRGLETMLPKAGKDVLRAARYSREGVQSLNGYSIVDEVDAWGVISQALGFMPAHIAEQYESNSSLKNAEQRILNERRHLMNRYALAVRAGDHSGRMKLVGSIADFNRRYPMVSITNDSIMQSLKRRALSQGRAAGGVLIDKRLEHLRDQA